MSRPVLFPVLVLAAVLPALALALLVLHYGVNMPYWDEWEWADLVFRFHSGTLSFADLWAQHNEHRILVVNLLMLALDRIHGWDVIAEQLVSVAIVVLTQLVVWRLIARTASRHARAVAFVLASALLFSLAQSENFSWGFQMGWFLCDFGVAAAVTLLTSPRRTGTHVALAIVAATIASYSSAQGLLAWPVGLLAVVLVPRALLRTAVVWCVSAAVVFAFYRGGMYATPTGHVAIATHIPLVTQYFLAYLGGPVAFGLGIATSALAGAAALIAFLGFATADLLRTQRLLHAVRRAPLYALGAYALAAAAMTSSGRAGFGVEQALSSRYTSISLMLYVALVGLGASSLRRPAGPRVFAASAAALMLALTVLRADKVGLDSWHTFASQRRADLRALATANGRGLGDSYPDPGRLAMLVDELRRIGDGPFYDR